MTESPRALFDRWVDAVNRQDRDAMAATLHPDYVDEMPQSGERTRGVDNLFAILDNYPRADEMRELLTEAEIIGDEGRWVLTPNYTVVEVEGASDVYTVTAHVRYPDSSHWYMLTLVRIKDGLIHRTTTFYAPEFPAPEWRAQWVERIDHR